MSPTAASPGATESGASTAHRVRGVLAIRPFRRLWGVTFLLSMADWLSILALSGLVTKLTAGYLAHSFGFSAVVLTQLLPGVVFAPLGGLLADRFDRRKVMVVVDLFRCGLFLSIAIIGSWWWLLAANFLVGSTSMFWIPAKDSAIPNLLRRKDQIETANQLSLVATYGISVVAAAGLYSLVTGLPANLHLWDSALGVAKVIVVVNGLLYLVAAIIVATRIPEISGRSHKQTIRVKTKKSGWFAMIRDGFQFVRTTRLIRGLIIGMIGAFAAGGAVIGTAHQYASSLLGGDATFGMLFVALFVGIGVGLTTTPKLARRMSHNRLFGVAIVAAGLALVFVAISPHLAFSLVVVAIVGACAGIAFLTGTTIIGSQVEDSIRGRINALYQSVMKAVPFISIALVSLLVGVLRPQHFVLFGSEVQVDATRPVLLGAGIIAGLAGVVAYRQMGDRSTEPILANLVATLRRRPPRLTGLLIAVEGATVQDTTNQATQLAEWLRAEGHQVELAIEPTLDDTQLAALLGSDQEPGSRARALFIAAARANMIERHVLPALQAGDLVITRQYVDSPLADLDSSSGLDPSELESLVNWATDRLRPDVTVFLDRDPSALPDSLSLDMAKYERHWRMRRLLTDMAEADPERYVVVEADGTTDEVTERARQAVAKVLTARGIVRGPAQPDVAQNDTGNAANMVHPDLGAGMATIDPLESR